MIGILLNDSAYEQDIRELLMAFYPGQTFAHEMRDITTYSVIQRFHDAPGVVKPFSLSGSQCILAKPQKKSIL